jgi:hypothetical protein
VFKVLWDRKVFKDLEEIVVFKVLLECRGKLVLEANKVNKA